MGREEEEEGGRRRGGARGAQPSGRAALGQRRGESRRVPSGGQNRVRGDEEAGAGGGVGGSAAVRERQRAPKARTPRASSTNDTSDFKAACSERETEAREVPTGARSSLQGQGAAGRASRLRG